MLLKPNIKLDRVTEITPELLDRLEISALILDVDNTLSTHHGMELVDGLPEWLEQMKQHGIKLVLVSNSLKKRVEPFAQKIGLPFISAGLKPLPSGFSRGKRFLKEKRKNIAIVGDQIFTDVLGGNFSGFTTILLTPIKLERVVYKLYKIKKTEM